MPAGQISDCHVSRHGQASCLGAGPPETGHASPSAAMQSRHSTASCSCGPALQEAVPWDLP